MILELLRDLDHAQKYEEPDSYGETLDGLNHEHKQGTNDDSYVEFFQTLLATRDTLGEYKDDFLPDWFEEFMFDAFQYIGRALKFANYHLIKVVAANINDAQTLLNKDLEMMEAGSFSIGISPSHTQIAKDDLSNAVHDLSGELAIEAIKQVGEKMMLVWDGTGKIDDVYKVLDKIMRHPVVSTWQDDIVTKWARRNSNSLCDACSPSAVIEGAFRALDEIDEALSIIDDYSREVSITEQLETYFDKAEALKENETLRNSIDLMTSTTRKQYARVT